MTTPRTGDAALYCRRTGRRLAPDDGRTPGVGDDVAIVVVDDGTTVPIDGDVVIGRDPAADRRVAAGTAVALELVDPERQVSRCHLLLRVRAWSVEVIDLGSSNGTALGEDDGSWTALVPGLGHEVPDGRPIRLGRRTLTVHRLQR